MPSSSSSATTVDAYLNALPEDRRQAIDAVRQVILKNLDANFEEGIQYGMIGYYVPHRIYPAGYHCDPKQPLPFVALGAQKNKNSLHLMCIYGDAEREQKIREGFASIGKKPDMGKACIRFKNADDLPLETIGKLIKTITAKKYIAGVEAALASRPKPAAKKKATSKAKTKTKSK